MSFLISEAYAASTQTTTDSLYSFWVIGLIFVLFYFMLIRPQNQRAKAQRDLLSTLKKGDEVVINGGILGKVSHLDEQYMKLTIAEGCEISVQRQSVNAILPKGTLKAV